MRAYAAAFVLTGLFSSGASAGILTFTDTMFGFNETPPNASPATGMAVVTVDTTASTLNVNETWTGLIGGPAAAAHIHCCAGPGVAAPVALPFTGFPAVTGGTYNNTFDLTMTGTYTAAFLTMGGGTAFGAETLLLNSMVAGNTYTNIHDAMFPAGEIRGQLALVTPEPSTLWGVGATLLGLAVLAYKRRVH